MSTRYTVAAVKVGEVFIKQITDQSFDTGLSAFFARGSGAIQVSHTSIDRFSPVITFTTAAIKTALTACGFLGVNLSTSNVLLYLQQYEDGATRTADACKTVTLVLGLMVLRSINAPERGAATCTYEIYPTSADGTTAPFTEQTAVAIPSADDADEIYWPSAPTGVLNWSIDSGITVARGWDPNKPWPVLHSLEVQQPTISGVMVGVADDLDATGPLVVSVVDKTQGGTVGSAPISFTAPANTPTKFVGRGVTDGGFATNGFTLWPYFNGTLVPITVGGLT